MFPLLILVVCLAVGLFLLGRWFVSADPKTLAWTFRAGGVALAAIVAVFLAVTGRLAWAAAAVGLLAPLLLRWRAFANRQKAARGPSPGGTSTVRTALLEVALEHDSGAVSGTVRSGRFAGRGLDDLTLDELRALYAEAQGADPQSAPIIAAFLDRGFGPDWRDAGAGEGARGRAGGPMTREEALDVLGLAPGASDQEIRDAHRRLMKRLHPDQGGSDYLAAKLNEAKDVLLR